MDNMWEASLPDVPHLEKDDECYICGEFSAETIVFQHNEGCHSSHCRRCLERMVELFIDETIHVDLNDIFRSAKDKEEGVT